MNGIKGAKAFELYLHLLPKSNENSQCMLLALIAQTEHHQNIDSLFPYLSQSTNIAYMAATAIKALDTRGYFDEYYKALTTPNISNQIKQIIIMHTRDLAKIKPIPAKMIDLLESQLHAHNDNMRYLSLIALADIGHIKSSSVIFKNFYKDNMSQFYAEMDKALLSLYKDKEVLKKELHNFLDIAKKTLKHKEIFDNPEKISKQEGRIEQILKLISRLYI